MAFDDHQLLKWSFYGTLSLKTKVNYLKKKNYIKIIISEWISTYQNTDCHCSLNLIQLFLFENAARATMHDMQSLHRVLLKRLE